MFFAEKEIYNKIKFEGLYKIKTYDTIFMVFGCDNDQFLIQTMQGEELIFIDQQFLDDYLEKVGGS